MAAIHRILVPTDFSDVSRTALDVACELATALQVPLVVMHASAPQAFPLPEGGILPSPERAAEEVATQTHALYQELVHARSRVPAAESLYIEGDPFAAIERAVHETGADLIVMGTHGRRGVAHALLGSVAEKLVQKGPCPVLAIRARE